MKSKFKFNNEVRELYYKYFLYNVVNMYVLTLTFYKVTLVALSLTNMFANLILKCLQIQLHLLLQLLFKRKSLGLYD